MRSSNRLAEMASMGSYRSPVHSRGYFMGLFMTISEKLHIIANAADAPASLDRLKWMNIRYMMEETLKDIDRELQKDYGDIDTILKHADRFAEAAK